MGRGWGGEGGEGGEGRVGRGGKEEGRGGVRGCQYVNWKWHQCTDIDT